MVLEHHLFIADRALRVNGELQLVLLLNDVEFESSKIIRTVVSATNKSNEVINLMFGSSNKLELSVSKSNVEIWNSSHGICFPMMIQNREINPGETITFTGKWNQTDNDGKQADPGQYTIKGILKAVNYQLETNSIAITIK